MDHADKVFRKAEQEFLSLASPIAPERRFRLASRVVCMRFGNNLMAEKLLPAFSHLELVSSNVRADLTICAWDQASAGESHSFPAPKSTEPGIDYGSGLVRILWSREEESFHAFDPRRNLALFRTHDVAHLPVWERAAPFRQVLHWWSANQGLVFLHAAAVGNETGGVVLVGAGGAGKSTTALATVGGALCYAGDDYCLVDPASSPRVYSVYCSGKANKNSIARLPRLAQGFDHSSLDQLGKSIIFISSYLPKAIIRSFPLKAIIAPKISGGAGCRAERLPRAEAMRALAPSTLFQVQGDRAQSFAAMATLVTHLPCWRFYVGDDPDDAQPLLEAIVAGRPVAA